MFFYFALILLAILFILAFSHIKIVACNIKLHFPKTNNRNLNENYKVTITLYILKKIPILKLDITKTKLEKLEIKNKLKDLEIKIINDRNNFDLETIKISKKLQPRIEGLNLKIIIGTEDAAITSYIVAIMSSSIGILLKNSLQNRSNSFTVTPIYINKNLFKLELNCIIKVKMIHIIYIIYILNKKRRDEKNERTSNRKSYGYSYE